VGDDVDGMAVQPDRPALRLLSRPAACMTANWCTCMARGIVPPRVSVRALVPQARAACHGPCTSRSRGRSCEAEASRARRRLLVRGGDLSGHPSCRELVGDTANWSESRCLASVGVDQGPCDAPGF
jgi:hypothetical protein